MNALISTLCSSFVILCCVSSIQCVPWPWQSRRPPYVECVSSEECPFDSCCVLGMGRYSIPICQKKLPYYETCRPASEEPMNTTVSFLDGNVVSLHNVHLMMCPCADGLSCNLKTGRCEDVDGLSSFNDLYDKGMIGD